MSADVTKQASIRARVLAGMKLLDEERPGWWQRINLRELAMSHCVRCVLGQIFGNYAIGQDVLFSGDDEEVFQESVGHGFNVYDQDDDEAYADLRDVWMDLIESRQQEA
jgi:hypothetical protein